jgi:fused signal recognition particle receptor
MEIAVIVLIVVVVAVVVGFGFVAARHRARATQPPPIQRRLPSERAGGTGTIEAPPRPTVPRPTPTPTPAPTPPEAEAPPLAPTPPEVLEREVVEPELVEPEVVVRPSFRDRLSKARDAIAGSFRSILGRTGIDQDTWDDLEEALIRADVGIELAQDVLDELRATAKEASINDGDALLEALKAQLKQRLAGRERDLRLDEGTTNVWLFVGVNGVGKTTTIGKVGKQQGREGRKVLMAAGDTFRAAAAEQLQTWAERADADFVRGAEGGDPSSVVFDGIQRAAARGYDLVLADTAGRLHTKSNLMDELSKVRRVASKEPGNVTEVLLVLDAVTGQNGLVQAAQFGEAVELTGVVLTKLDGSAKGGIVLAIESRLGIPVKLVGLGEGIDDLVPFDPDEFVEALFE